VRWECRSAEYAQNTALFPLTDLFQRILQFEAYETPDAKLAKLEHALSQYRLSVEESVPLLVPLLALPVPATRYPPLHLSPQRQRQKTLEAYESGAWHQHGAPLWTLPRPGRPIWPIPFFTSPTLLARPQTGHRAGG
jgi:hypothetical protein